MSQFYHIGGVFPGRHWSSLVVIGCHWQSSVFRRTRQYLVGVYCISNPAAAEAGRPGFRSVVRIALAGGGRLTRRQATRGGPYI